MKRLATFIPLLALVSTATAAQLVSFQNADVVLGQPNFTTIEIVNGQANRFSSPQGVAMDPATGKVFVADSGHNRILRFSSLAAMHNGSNPEAVIGQADFAAGSSNQGGAAAANTLNSSRSITVDSQGRLWVADADNNRVLGFYQASSLGNNPAADIVLGQPDFTTTSGGVTAAKTNNPGGVAVGADGTLWVADADNNRVLRFANVTSKVTGAAADGVLGQVNFTSANAATTVNGMRSPYALSVDASGRLWVADTENSRVLRFDSPVAEADADGSNADGVLGQPNFDTATEGRSATELNNDYGVYAAPDGWVWVGDYSNSRVVGFADAASLPAGAAATVVLGQADFDTQVYHAAANRLGGPGAVAGGPGGSLLVIDYDFNRVLRFSPITSAPPVVSPAPGVVIATKSATTTKASLVIKGRATGSVSSVTYRVGSKGKFKPAKGSASWKFTAKLKPGTNVIFVVANGPGGKSSTKKITIRRK